MNGRRAPWYGAPVVWLGAMVLLISIAGCISLMLLAAGGHEH